MRYQERIYIQNESTCVRNSDILNVNMSSDLCSFTSPRYDITGATKIIDDTKSCDISGTSYNDMILTAITDCFLSKNGENCFKSLSWDLEINEDAVQVFSATVTTSTATADTITQSDVNNAVVLGFNTLGYEYSQTGSTFAVTKPYGVENLTIDLCLDIILDNDCTVAYSGCGCPSGYTINPAGDSCVYSAVTAATYLGSGGTISVGDTSTAYGTLGTRFYEDITNKPFPITRVVDSSPIYDDDGVEVTAEATVNSSFWGLGTVATGRLNNIGIGGNPDTEWKGFSVCIDLPTTNTYYIGMAADNWCRFYINGELIVNFPEIGSSINRNFQYWHVFPITLLGGKNIIEMEGKNTASVHAFGFELYSGTTVPELTGATNESEANSFWNTLLKTGDTFDMGDTVGYSCPSGYSLDLCAVSAICTQIIYTGFTRCDYTDNCDILCVELCDNTYDVLTTGDTGVYIVDTATTIDLGFQFTANTSEFVDKEAIFKYEIYKYNHSTGVFSSTAQYKSDEFDYSTFSGTSAFTESIPISGLSLDGDYLIKGYYVFDVCTDFLGRLGLEVDTSTNKSGDEYGIYKKAFDHYFVAFNKADSPTFSYNTGEDISVGTLVGFSVFPDFSGQTAFTITQSYQGSPIVALNGLTLVENIEYYFDTTASTLNISGGTVLDDVITVVFVSDGNNSPGLINDFIQITSPIISGTTGNEGSSDVYFNITEGKYEIYTTVTPNSVDDLIVTLNGLTLAPNIDYYQSTSNSKRIILQGQLLVGDVINIYYNGNAQYIGNVYSNTPTINWEIENAPGNNNGVFTVEVANSGDTGFTSLITTATTNYVTNQTAYSAQITLSGDVGTNYIYRIKNEKRYTSLIGDVISSINYSETIPITIQSNAINSY
jgi:hypothetical protein